MNAITKILPLAFLMLSAASGNEQINVSVSCVPEHPTAEETYTHASCSLANETTESVIYWVIEQLGTPSFDAQVKVHDTWRSRGGSYCGVGYVQAELPAGTAVSFRADLTVGQYVFDVTTGKRHKLKAGWHGPIRFGVYVEHSGRPEPLLIWSNLLEARQELE